MDLIRQVHGGNRVELAGWESVSEHDADTSAGGIGMDNWMLTLVRNLAGHQALQVAIDDDWIETRPLKFDDLEWAGFGVGSGKAPLTLHCTAERDHSSRAGWRLRLIRTRLA